MGIERRAGAVADRQAAAARRRPMCLVLGNPRYQRCQLVQEAARLLDIQLVYLPSYSLNLNLIERFWKFLNKQASPGGLLLCY